MYELAIYGGAFNPPHAGHANVMIEASKQARQVMVVPSYKHPFGKVMTDYALRLEWLNLIVKRVRPLCDGLICASNIEYELAQKMEGPIFSFDLLCYIAKIMRVDTKQIALVVGPDVAELLPTFHLGPELLDQFSIITVPEQVGVRSTAMRKCLESGEALPAHWMAPGLDPVNYRIYASGAAI
jgi:nicotinate-nucleotide adenylyltransferase